MFSRKTDASKVSLVRLVDLMRASGFALLDTQFMNEHLKQFGAYEVTRDRYLAMLASALRQDVRLPTTP
jgi:leucyl/phenylalanyl-tRNA--protein transferase